MQVDEGVNWSLVEASAKEVKRIDDGKLRRRVKRETSHEGIHSIRKLSRRQSSGDKGKDRVKQVGIILESRKGEIGIQKDSQEDPKNAKEHQGRQYNLHHSRAEKAKHERSMSSVV
jgi:hypothetical protein